MKKGKDDSDREIKYMLGRESLARKVIFQQRLKRSEGVSHGGRWGKKLIILGSWSTKSGP